MSFLTDLNPVQREAVEATDGPVMIVAGAGSGKTRVLTYRAAHLIDRGVPPQAILALTFTNKAAEEMKARINALVGDAGRAIWMGTFHSLFARLLRFEGERIGFTRSFTIYDTDDSLALIKRVMGGLGISAQQYSPQGIRSRISLAKNQMLTPDELGAARSDPWAERAARVFEAYQHRLKESNAMDFDDLLLMPLRLFREAPDVLARYRQRFRYVLVDEYQDTNRVQYRLIRELTGNGGNICVVGDDAQSIYAFRGADIRNILDFEKDYASCRVFRLEQNYRSTGTILAAADSLIKRNKGQIPKTLWTQNGAGERILVLTSESDLAEGYAVVEKVEEESRRNKRDLKDFAVLYRTNAQSRTLEDALRRSGIPYVIVGGVAFYKRREIKDVLAYLRLLVNPRDEESLLRIINVPARSIGETSISRIRRYAERQGLTLFEALSAEGLQGEIGERQLGAVRGFHRMVAKYLALKPKVSPSELARALVDELGMLRVLKEENTPESLARRENVLELVSALTEFSESRPQSTLEEFLEEVSLVSDIDMADFGHNAVTLMTVHAAKGLEFPVVFITGLEEGLFPISSALESPEELEEERRLMYVAMTRAKARVILSHALTRYRFGEMTYSLRSRFLEEIEPACLDGAARPPSPRPRAAAGRAPGMPARPGRRQKPGGDFYADPLPDYENESQDLQDLRVGQQVHHAAFGPGRVIALDGKGEQARAIVDFEAVGRKHLMLKFAHLRIS
jgi:DNA helicase-2/ATP-dependent DNA helicase PcrA